MSFKDLPDNTKRNIALFSALLISIGIFLFWILDFVPNAKKQLSENKEETVAIFSKVTDNVSNTYQAIKGRFGEIKEQIDFIRVNQEQR